MPKKLVCLFLYLHAKTQQPTSGAFYQHPCKSDCWFWNLLSEKWGRSSQDSASLSKREEQGVSPLHEVLGNTNQLSRYLEGRKCHWNQWFTHSFNKCFIQCLTLCPTLLPGTKASHSVKGKGHVSSTAELTHQFWFLPQEHMHSMRVGITSSKPLQKHNTNSQAIPTTSGGSDEALPCTSSKPESPLL